mgnify:CR=1 FL=1
MNKYEKSMSIYTRIDGNFKSLSQNHFDSGNNYVGFDLRQPIKKTALRINANTSNINKNQSVILSGIDQTKKDVIDLGAKYTEIKDLADRSEIIFLTIKPNKVEEISQQLKNLLSEFFSSFSRFTFIFL